MAAGTTRAIAYIHTAITTANKEHCTEGQALRIERYCHKHGFMLVGSFADHGVSGGAKERSGLRAALAILAEGQADVLVVVNVSRLTRSVAALARLTQAHFGDGTHGLIALDEGLDTRTLHGRFVLSLLGAAARWDAEASRHAQ